MRKFIYNLALFIYHKMVKPSHFLREVGGRIERWCRGILLIWKIVGQGPNALAIGAGGSCLDLFTLVYHFSLLSPSQEDGPI